MPSRASTAVLTDDSREARDIEISFRFPWAVLFGLVMGLFRDLEAASQDSPRVVPALSRHQYPVEQIVTKGVGRLAPTRGLAVWVPAQGRDDQRFAPPKPAPA